MTEITVNNTKYQIKVADDTPLLWVLRDHLKLKGTKFGCGKGLCGACTVHIDGQESRACSISLQQVKNKKITTIEGLQGNKLHPLQQAWIELDVPQCGYCQPGQLMTAAALLSKNKNPTEAEINTAMSGNICRCGTYVRIRKAIQQAAKQISENTPVSES